MVLLVKYVYVCNWILPGQIYIKSLKKAIFYISYIQKQNGPYV